MADLLYDIEGKTGVITFNRVKKNNAFDDHFLKQLQIHLDTAIAEPAIKAILLKANGDYFSAGADLAWMQRAINFNETENIADALILARVLRTLYDCPKPTIAAVQGAAYGGGIGIIAACDIAIAADSSAFCFSEAKIGLIPAIISPYVVKAIGERAAKWLFISAESITALQAQQLNLVQHCVEKDNLLSFAKHYAERFLAIAPQAITDCKLLVDLVNNKPITDDLMLKTAALIAKKRVSTEGQQGLRAFLNK